MNNQKKARLKQYCVEIYLNQMNTYFKKENLGVKYQKKWYENRTRRETIYGQGSNPQKRHSVHLCNEDIAWNNTFQIQKRKKYFRTLLISLLSSLLIIINRSYNQRKGTFIVLSKRAGSQSPRTPVIAPPTNTTHMRMNDIHILSQDSDVLHIMLQMPIQMLSWNLFAESFAILLICYSRISVLRNSLLSFCFQDGYNLPSFISSLLNIKIGFGWLRNC